MNYRTIADLPFFPQVLSTVLRVVMIWVAYSLDLGISMLRSPTAFSLDVTFRIETMMSARCSIVGRQTLDSRFYKPYISQMLRWQIPANTGQE